MSSARTDRWLIIALFFTVISPLVAAPPDKKSSKSPPRSDKAADKKTDQAALEKLIRRLGSDSYKDREEAMKELRRLGKPALEGLRTAASSSDDKEILRRAAALVDRLLDPPYSKRYKESVKLLEEKKDYRKAAALLKEAAEMYEKDPEIPRATTGSSDQPILAEIYLHLARARRGYEAYEEAGRAYSRATYYYNYNYGKRGQIDAEWKKMIDELLAQWNKGIKARIAKDVGLKALTGKYPLVVLHSRRYAGGGYLKSAYSFIDETADEDKHHNRVQVLFDNGGKGNTFTINMTTDQKNLMVDLGNVEFTKDPDPKKVDPDSDNFWVPDRCKVVEGHVYLERILDGDGNKFYTVLKVIAADKRSRYVAFIWRRLPGGKVVK